MKMYEESSLMNSNLFNSVNSQKFYNYIIKIICDENMRMKNLTELMCYVLNIELCF